MKNKRRWMIPALVIVALAAAFLLYSADYYHADAAAQAALVSDGNVRVSRTSYGCFFDGPSEEDALVFYPGAKIEETAYAPLLRGLAGEGMDVCLVSMPFRLAFFGTEKADAVMAQHSYGHWYVGGHSLGGAMAAEYAARHRDRLTGLILLAAYPTRPLDDTLLMISIYGSEDGILNLAKVKAGEAYAPGDLRECVVPGGNHAQFGNYGEQRGDGSAAITREEQQRTAISYIIRNKR